MLRGEQGDHRQVVITVIIGIVIASMNIFNYCVVLYIYATSESVTRDFLLEIQHFYGLTAYLADDSCL